MRNSVMLFIQKYGTACILIFRYTEKLYIWLRYRISCHDNDSTTATCSKGFFTFRKTPYQLWGNYLALCTRLISFLNIHKCMVRSRRDETVF